MPKAYSQDLRAKIFEFYENNSFTQAEVAEQFGINISTFKRILKKYREDGTFEIKPYSNGRPPTIGNKDIILIEKFVLKTKDATLEEIRQYYLRKTQIEVSIPTIFRLLNKLDLRRKKKSNYAQEQERDDIKKKT
jgi:transposase